MTAIEVATGIIDKLQEENRVCLETLHKAQDTIKYSENKLAEKERLIKVLEERLRSGTDGILEMTNRQKELTIKHLEMQIQKLIKENENLEVRLDTIKAEICPKCETKLLLRENRENVGPSKYTAGKSVCERKSSQTTCPNRIKSLERIVEHKDKRIMHMTKEIQRLTKLEKELTQKVYRLTKLLPMSRLPPEAVTDCLLKEIQLLESQKQGSGSEPAIGILSRGSKSNPSISQASVSKSNLYRSADRFKKCAVPKFKKANLPESEQVDVLDKVENEVLHKKLQKLCQDVNELKRLFEFESDTLSHNLNSAASEYHIFKINLEEIIKNLNEIVQSILNHDFSVHHLAGFENELNSSDDKYAISGLQKRLQESLGIITEYENENKVLKESLDKLKAQIDSSDYGLFEKESKLFSDSKEVPTFNDVKKLQDVIKMKDIQLEYATNHLNTCQKLIEELQNNPKPTASDSTKRHHILSSKGMTTDSFYEQQNKLLQTKLDVAERNIKTCETVIERLQNSVHGLEEENVKIESELHVMKIKAVAEESGTYSKFSESHVNTLKKFNQELQDKVKALEETNAKLEAKSKSNESKNRILKAVDQEKTLLKSKLDASEKHICTLEKSVEALQEKLRIVEDEKTKLECELKDITVRDNLAEAYQDDIMALKNELILKEGKINELTESLRTLENKTSEMNHYRKSLHEEIENLCKTLMENEESEGNARRKAIYKAAVSRSAQALLGLDDNYNLKPDDPESNTALDEIKHQLQVYLTQVSRIHELVTIKEHNRDEIVKDYLDLPDDDVLRLSHPRYHESHVKGQHTFDDLESSPNTNHYKLPDLHANDRGPESQTASDKNTKIEISMPNAELKILQNELAETKSVTSYLLSSCTRLENLLSEERTELIKCKRELEVHEETVKDLKSQLSMKHTLTRRLNTLIDMMRSKECNDDIALEQLRSETRWLVEENQKVFERVTATQSELCKCREENCRIQNDLDSLKRQLMNEKYENAKVNNELKHLKSQISNSQSMLNETPII